MTDTYEFLKQVLDAITEQIVVIDDKGEILFVNRSWSSFGANNEYLVEGNWKGLNYLEVCDEAAKTGDEFGLQAASEIRKVINGESAEFHFEYPCHSPDDNRWFMMQVTPFTLKDSNCFVISHQNITERKLAEEEALSLSRVDALTSIPNRRHFDEFLDNEWNRCARLGMPVSLALIDADHFKLLNDTYGQQVGDDCLKNIAKTLEKFAQRPSDLCARYGGEEFALIYGNTNLEVSRQLINHLNDEIISLKIPNEKAPTLPTLTTSIGLATMLPDKFNKPDDLIAAADKLVYAAKEQGRNQVLTG
jgi:diguanylate cyclase (GGDEF)-like protein/PAS domain S-box-containing protein